MVSAYLFIMLIIVVAPILAVLSRSAILAAALFLTEDIFWFRLVSPSSHTPLEVAQGRCLALRYS